MFVAISGSSKWCRANAVLLRTIKALVQDKTGVDTIKKVWCIWSDIRIWGWGKGGGKIW